MRLKNRDKDQILLGMMHAIHCFEADGGIVMKELEYICGLNGTYTRELLKIKLLSRGWVRFVSTNINRGKYSDKYFLTESGFLVYQFLMERQKMISGITEGGDEADILRTEAIQAAIKSKRGKARLV